MWQRFILSVIFGCCILLQSCLSTIIANKAKGEGKHDYHDMSWAWGWAPTNWSRQGSLCHQWPATLTLEMKRGTPIHCTDSVITTAPGIVNFTYLLRGRQSPWQAVRQPWWVAQPTYQLGGCAQPCPVCVYVWPQSNSMKAQSANQTNSASTLHHKL